MTTDRKLTDIGLMGISARDVLTKRDINLDDVLYGSPELMQLNIINLLYLLERHYAPLLSGRFLDLFCGKGYVLQGIAQEHPALDLYGIDGNEEVIVEAKRICPAGHFSNQLCPPLPYEHNFFNIVYANKIMDYSDTQSRYGHIFPTTFSLEELSREMYRTLDAGGIYVPGDILTEKEQEILRAVGFESVEKSGSAVFEKR